MMIRSRTMPGGAQLSGTASLRLVLLLSIVASVIAVPIKRPIDDRPSLQTSEATSSAPHPALDTELSSAEPRKRGSRKKVERVDDKSENPGRRELSAKERKKGRKHKSFFLDYPYLGIPRYSVPTYDYENEFELSNDQSEGKKYQESNIFYIQLPPTPYMFVPGLGYISQPPTYSTAGLLPQISQPRPLKRPVNPFIKLPIDFVSNGKPTSVYQWQKKPGAKKPATDSPITNLDNLSADFVSNGKPTSIYQWQTNLKPFKRPDDTVNHLDKGPYAFNGRPASLYLLRSDGSSALRQNIRFPNYQEHSGGYY